MSALDPSPQLLAQFPEMNPGPVVRTDRKGTVLLANAAARAAFGGENLIGRSWLDLCPGIDADAWGRILSAVGRTTHEAEVSDTCFSFVHVASADPESVFVYGSDVTERKRAARLLAEQAAELTELARFPEMNPGPTLRTDLDGKILIANAAARAVYGAGVTGKSWLELCPSIDKAAWDRVLVAIEPVPFDAKVGDRDYIFAHRRDHQGRLVFVYGADVTAQRRAERALRQTEKMATLGTLAAGVAHELNNPAAATRRAAEQLDDAFVRLEETHGLLASLAKPPARSVLDAIERRIRETAGHPPSLSALARSDAEAAIEEWLDEHDVAEAWSVAPGLVSLGFDRAALQATASELDGDALSAVLSWAAAAFPVRALLHEIGEGASRISEIVRALKTYSYLGQAPVQAVDLHEGLDNTLVILRSKLKKGIEVTRDYGADVPKIIAWGSELNQVWTNLLDNAADALGPGGNITLRTRRDGDHVIVAVEDDGPGIPEAVQPRIFDPFFTTKEPGKGTGLGLSTTHTVVTERHRGTIHVSSRPGRTVFEVRLAIAGAGSPVESGKV